MRIPNVRMDARQTKQTRRVLFVEGTDKKMILERFIPPLKKPVKNLQYGIFLPLEFKPDFDEIV